MHITACSFSRHFMCFDRPVLTFYCFHFTLLQYERCCANVHFRAITILRCIFLAFWPHQQKPVIILVEIDDYSNDFTATNRSFNVKPLYPLCLCQIEWLPVPNGTYHTRCRNKKKKKKKNPPRTVQPDENSTALIYLSLTTCPHPLCDKQLEIDGIGKKMMMKKMKKM